MSAATVVVKGTNVCDASGVVIPSAVISFQPCALDGTPLSVRVGNGGQSTVAPVTAQVTNGVFSATLLDTSQTSPENLAYEVQISLPSGKKLLGPGYLIQPSSTSALYYSVNGEDIWTFDNFSPGVGALSVIQNGPPGPATSIAIGPVTTLAAGQPASATMNGTAPNLTLDLAIPQGVQGPAGPTVPSLPVYTAASAGVAAISSGSYFLIPSASTDGLYDLYENVSGTATLVATIPAKRTTSSTASALRVVDSAGFIYDVAAFIQTLKAQVAAMEAEGLTVFASAAAAIAAGIETGAYFFIPSTSVDGAYDVYQNVNGAASFVLTIQKRLLTSSTASPLRIVDSAGFVYDIAAAVLAQASASNAANLPAAINALNTTCGNYSRGMLFRASLSLASPQYQYNYLPWYGQSLSTGYQTLAYVSTAAKYGNLMVGQYPIKSGNGQAPYGNSLFNPLKETSQVTSGETECSGMANTAKRLLNDWRCVANDTTRTLVTNSLGAPGEPASLLVPTAAIASGGTWTGNFWSAVTNFMNAAATDAASASGGGGVAGTIGAAGFFYCQGENDFTDSTNGDPGLATYMANVLAIRQGFDAACQGIFGQSASQQAGMYTYQTGDEWTSDATGLAMQNAQWLMALTQPNWFLFGPHYPYPDLGGHLTANSYRWLGSMAAKVWFRTSVQRQGWQPLSPHQVTMFNSTTLLVGFHVPVPPLTIATAYNGSTACNYADLGFSLQDATGYATITVSIVADQVIQITASRPIDWTTAILRYADQGGSGSGAGSIVHNGVGNLCDSDPLTADDVYVASANQSGTPDGTVYDFANLVGNPYPLNNWCIAFQLRPYTFNTTGPTIG